MTESWMKRSIGVSFHWTSNTTEADGSRGSYREAVDAFDADHFVSALRDAGAGHCIFTLTHAKQYLAFPNEPLEALLPGRTVERDLIGEITDGLSASGIRLIAYYNHSCNGDDDPEWKKACGYADGIHGDLDRFADNICRIVSHTAQRYGKKLAGWWFDSAYSVDPRGPYNTITCEMGSWRFPWDRLVDAAKAGCGECAVSVNAGIGQHYLYTPRQEYYAGETVNLDEAFPQTGPNGMCDHRWICLDNPAWVFSGPRAFADPRFSDEEVLAFVRGNLEQGRMTTFNLEIDRSGYINPKSLSQFDRIRSRL